MRDGRFRRGLGLTALALVAAIYFYGGMFCTLDRTDEGQIVYASWRTAEGDLPYVDFQHLYGPSLFFTNALLFRVFGTDLQVLRVFLVAVKALIVVLVYVLARRVARRGASLAVTAALVCVWGMPVWLFNTPYATYYTTALCLGSMLLASREHGASRFASGLCLGLATTFKQTQGIFGFLALVLFLVQSAPPRVGPPLASCSVARLVGVARLIALVGTLGFGAAYVAPHLTSWTAMLLLFPLAASVVALLVRELTDWPPGAGALAAVRGLAFASVGMALPLVAYAVAYARLGGLGALVDNVVAGLPQRISWWVPLAGPDWRTVWFCGTVVSTFAVLRAWHAGKRRTLAASLVVLAGFAGATVLAARGPFGLGPYVFGGWTGEVIPLLLFAPLLVLAVAVPGLVRRDPEVHGDGDAGMFALLFFFGAVGVLILYPCADPPHGAMMLPMFLPLVAARLSRLGRRIPGATLLVCVWLAGLVWPFVRPRLALATIPATPFGTFARASGIVAADPKGAETARLVRYLSGANLRDGGLLVLTNEEMLYFLVGVRSALPREEFVLFLVGADLMPDDVARTLVDEDAVIDRLARARPLVVDYAGSTETTRFRAAFPRVTAFVDATYELRTTIDGYRVLAPRGSGAG